MTQSMAPWPVNSAFGTFYAHVGGGGGGGGKIVNLLVSNSFAVNFNCITSLKVSTTTQ